MSNQLFFLSLADIFSVYPTLFEELTSRKTKPTQVLLPTDWNWRERVYSRLLEIQKRINDAIEGGMTFEDVTKRKEATIFDARDSVDNETRINKCELQQKFYTANSVYWSLDNIAKAAKLLKKPPLSVKFKNELEMRKVYSLIYDVFRFKMVLQNALNEILFYESNPQFVKDENRIWLMLYELFHRSFKCRPSEELEVQRSLFKEAEVLEIAQCLWDLRVRLSGSLSRMRIKYGALNLAQLLPIHLQNEKVAMAASNPTVTGWMNPFLVRDRAAAEKLLKEMGFELQSDDTEALSINQYKWDTVCPLFLSCLPKDRNEFSRSRLISKHYFILQDKTFAYGPAIMSKLLDYYELDGDVLQTHISSPRATAYLASLFYGINRVNNFYVYGAGYNLREYRNYMESLCITNIRLFGEAYATFPLESNRFATVVGIFANPPNSFSAISDPIDLICSRGGDLSMLEVLTESEISDDGKRRVSLILEEQLQTLQMAMMRSHTQFIFYQTHSIVQSENADMVKYVVELINALSLQKHISAFRERKRLQALIDAELANLPSAAMSSPRKRNPNDGDGSADDDEQAQEEEREEDVKLPGEDAFEIEHTIPDICINQDNCLHNLAGCYFSLIKRQIITRHNAKYLIKMAELRGLFGGDGEKTSRQKSMKTTEMHNIEKSTETDYNDKRRQLPSSQTDNLLARLQHDTNASYIRSHLIKMSRQLTPMTFNIKGRECPRYTTTTTKFIKYCWKYAFENALSSERGLQIFYKYGICKFKRLHFYIYKRKSFPLHIIELKMILSNDVQTQRKFSSKLIEINK